MSAPKPVPRRTALRRERDRVAGVLHNTTCQELTGICLMAVAAARQQHALCPEAAAQFRELARLVQAAGTSLGEFVRTLRDEPDGGG